MKEQLIENFVGKEVCDYINSYMKDYNLLDHEGRCIIYMNKDSGSNAICMNWFPEIFSLMNDLENKGLKNSLIYDLFNLIGKNMCSVFNFKNSEIVYETSHYRCFGTELETPEGMNPHADHYGEGGAIHTAVLYLNDDYEGGEVTFFENHQLDNPTKYKPKSGSLLYFHGYQMHSVANVSSGKRACIVLHIREKEMV
ncbi:hypothetical protein EBQ93_00085 [bacterium]|nr:hypothetical protein [bacterium]